MSKVQEGKHRRNSGNMMLLSILGFILLFAFITMGTSFSMVLFLQSQVQKLADEVAMAGACQLNDGNRFGQMNDLVARCRELVFASRQNCDTSFNNRNKELEQLTQQLLDEDRQNALLLEKERASLRTLAIKEATLTMNDVFSRQKAVYGLALPWLVVRPPVLSDLRFGSISAIDSNESAQQGIEELIDSDRSSKLIQRNMLYRGNIDAKLPGEDSDLHFYISSLAAPVKGTIAPTRTVLINSFQAQTATFLPTAVAVSINIGLRTDLVRDVTTDFTITGAATTVGASPAR